MDITKILEELRREREQLEEAILSLERLAAGGKRRGRPPAWLAAAQQSTAGPAPSAPRGPGRPTGSKNKKAKKKAQPDSSENE